MKALKRVLKKRNVFLLMLAGMLVLAGCGSSGTTNENESSGSNNSGSAEPIKIGAIYPLTGSNALLGQESFRGLELAVEEWNEKGGIQGRPIEIVKADAPDANAAQSEANRLITREKVNVIFGSYASGISLAASEVAERNKVLYWELGAVSDDVTNRGYQYILRTNSPASYYSKMHISFIHDVVAEKLGKKPEELKIAIVHEDGSYGTTIAANAVVLAEQRGMQVVSVLPYKSTSNDLSSVILSLKDVQPDVIIAVSYLNDAVLLARQSKELGLQVPVFIGSGGGHTMKDFYDQVGELAEGVLNVDFPQYAINRDITTGLDEFIQKYEAKYGHFPTSGHSMTNYMGMMVALDVMNQVDELTPEAIREAAMNYSLKPGESVNGWGVQFDPSTGQNLLADPYVHQWIDGELKVVWPQEMAVAEPQIGQ